MLSRRKFGWAYAACKSGEALPSTVLRQKVSVVLSTRPVCLSSFPGSLSGALVNLEVVIRSVVDDEDRLWWQMRNQFLLDPLQEVVPIHLIVVVSST